MRNNSTKIVKTRQFEEKLPDQITDFNVQKNAIRKRWQQNKTETDNIGLKEDITKHIN